MSEEFTRIARAMLKDFDSIMSAVSDQVWDNVPAYSTLLLEC